MEIQPVSINTNQTRLEEQTTMQIQAAGYDTTRVQPVITENPVPNTQAVSDPSLGQYLNFTA